MKKAFLCILTALIFCNATLGAVTVSQAINFAETQNGISVSVSTVSPEEAAKFFDGRGKHLKDITPVKIAVANESDRAIGFGNKAFNMPLLNSHSVLEKIGYSAKGRSAGIGFGLGIGAASLIIAATAIELLIKGTCAPMCPCCIFMPLFVAAGSFVIITPIAATVSGVTYSKKNNKLKNSIEASQVKESMRIEPGESTELLVFVRTKEIKPFDIRFNQIGTQAKHIVHVQ